MTKPFRNPLLTSTIWIKKADYLNGMEIKCIILADVMLYGAELVEESVLRKIAAIDDINYYNFGNFDESNRFRYQLQLLLYQNFII